MAFDIPLFDLNFDDHEVDAVAETVRSKWISMGQRTVELEERFAARLGVKHVIAVTNCTAALHMACVLAGLGPEDEVIVPSLTFVATANAVRYTGARPVFADIISARNLSLDPDDVQRKITQRTRAILPMHYGGWPCPMERFAQIADEHRLVIIEDAAHTIDVDYHGRKLGTWGKFGCYSFFSNKVITSAEGGLLATDDDQLAARAKLIRSHGMTTLSYQRAQGHATRYDVVEPGYNYRIDDIRASLALAQETKLDGILARRKELRAVYEKALGDVDGITVPYMGMTENSANYIMPIVIDSGGEARRDAIRQYLADHGIQTSVHYPAIHRFSIYAGTHHLPTTDYVADHLITLPMYDSLTEEQVGRVADTLQGALAKHN
ncbi:DegT/DnrJ/EryC1/StrS family aminotransferase [bacterium]|nr:DegT/DnrJ/EryC1/StrS family aminotransferase [bacterium]